MIDKLEKLISEYTKQFPSAENPLNYAKQFGFDALIEMLEKRDGKQISYLEDDAKSEDGGKLIYI